MIGLDETLKLCVENFDFKAGADVTWKKSEIYPSRKTAS